MQEVAVVRRAAKDVLSDIEPERLRSRILTRLDESSMSAGVLTGQCADAVLERRGAGTTHSTFDQDDDSLREAIVSRAVGVQLIYEGLQLTRTLAQDPPWLDDQKSEGDLDVLIANILVAKGSHLLARTEAADEAVSTVQSFGRDQTVRRETDESLLTNRLEANVYELATVAGTTAVGGQPSPQLREYASSLARDPSPRGPTGPVETTRLSTLVSIESTAGEGVRTSADH